MFPPCDLSVCDSAGAVNTSGGDDPWATAALPLFWGAITLQDSVESGDAREKAYKPDRVGWADCPILLRATLNHLRRKHRNLSTLAAVCRYVTRVGVTVLRDLPSVNVLRQKQREAYLTKDEVRLSRLTCASFRFSPVLGGKRGYLNISVFHSTAGELGNLTEDIGLSTSGVAGLALLFGLCQDADDWIPRCYAEDLAREAKCALAWLDNWAESV